MDADDELNLTAWMSPQKGLGLSSRHDQAVNDVGVKEIELQLPRQLAGPATYAELLVFRERIELKRTSDLCAPSHFRELDDAAETNTGTSAACGFAAGILTALRSTDAGRKRHPEELRDILRKTSAGPGDAKWDPRLGFGVIDGAAALAAL